MKVLRKGKKEHEKRENKRNEVEKLQGNYGFNN